MRAHRVGTSRTPRTPRTPSGASARGGRDPQRATGAPAPPTAESVVALQRTAGNRVTRQALRGRGPFVSPGPVVQRAAYGLDLQPSQDAYVDHAARLHKTQKRMPIKDFVNAVMGTVAGELKAARVPLFGWSFVTGGGASGVFDSEAWKVLINVSAFKPGAASPPSRLQDLTPDELTEVVGTLYHEARHADQDVVIIRSLLDQGRTPAQIHAATKIRKDVVQAVKTTAYATKLDPDQVAHAGRMFDVMYGVHKELLELLVQKSAAFGGIDALNQTGSSIPAGARHVRTFTAWQKGVLQPKLTRMAAAKNPTATEKALRLQLQAVDTAITTLAGAWAKVAGVKRPPAADADAVRVAAGAVRDAVYTAYKDLEGEVDAFRVESKVKSAFATRIATP